MKKVIVLLLLIAFSLSVNSNCRRYANVKYMTSSGWSKKYYVQVNFLTGYELNQATSSFNYSSYSKYAVIFWGDDQATVIKLNTPLICGMEITCDCLDNVYTDLVGYDQDGDKWNICMNDYCY